MFVNVYLCCETDWTEVNERWYEHLFTKPYIIARITHSRECFRQQRENVLVMLKYSSAARVEPEWDIRVSLCCMFSGSDATYVFVRRDKLLFKMNLSASLHRTSQNVCVSNFFLLALFFFSLQKTLIPHNWNVKCCLWLCTFFKELNAWLHTCMCINGNCVPMALIESGIYIFLWRG